MSVRRWGGPLVRSLTAAGVAVPRPYICCDRLLQAVQLYTHTLLQPYNQVLLRIVVLRWRCGGLAQVNYSTLARAQLWLLPARFTHRKPRGVSRRLSCSSHVSVLPVCVQGRLGFICTWKRCIRAAEAAAKTMFLQPCSRRWRAVETGAGHNWAVIWPSGVLGTSEAPPPREAVGRAQVERPRQTVAGGTARRGTAAAAALASSAALASAGDFTACSPHVHRMCTPYLRFISRASA
eukprot:355285-Chlamydomonas_euryale.AAC.1